MTGFSFFVGSNRAEVTIPHPIGQSGCQCTKPPPTCRWRTVDPLRKMLVIVFLKNNFQSRRKLMCVFYASSCWCLSTEFFYLCNTALSSLIFKYKFEFVTITISSVSYSTKIWVKFSYVYKYVIWVNKRCQRPTLSFYFEGLGRKFLGEYLNSGVSAGSGRGGQLPERFL